MTKIDLTRSELEGQLSRQITLLKSHIETYRSIPDVAVDIATKVRLLCYDTKSQKSLLSQLDLKNETKVLDTPNLKSENNEHAPFCGLVYLVLDFNSAYFIPKFNNIPNFFPVKHLNFDDWWSAVIIRDYKGRELTRRDLILEVADTDGGAHVDNALKETYHFVSRQHSLTWKFKKDNQPEIPVTGVELASICQIGYELTTALDTTFIPEPFEISTKAMTGEFAVSGSPCTKMFGRPLPFRMVMSRKEPDESERNLPCRCESGIKAKECCTGTTVALYTDPI